MAILASLIETIEEIATAQSALAMEERKLLGRRARLDEAMREALVALADLNASTEAAGAFDPAPPFVPSVPPGARKGGGAKLQVGARRRYMEAAVKACREIILALGRPATIGEIHASHPSRSRLTPKMLHRALDQRARYPNPPFLRKDGVFWVADKPLPEGWVHPKGTPWEVKPVPFRAKPNKRSALLGIHAAKG